MIPVFKNVGERSIAKNYRHVSLLSMVSKFFSQLYLIELLGLLTGLGLLKLWHLIYQSLLTVFGMLIYFINVKSFRSDI